MDTIAQLKLLEKARAFVIKKHEGDKSGHDVNHIFRVVKLAKHIASLVEEKVNLFLLEIVVLLHDIDDPKLNEGDQKLVRKFLIENAVPLYYQVMIEEMIDSLSYTSSKNGKKETFIEGKIAQDADRLDAIGAIGIARVFAYGGNKNRPLDGDSEDASLKHFDVKLLKLKDMMNLEVSKKIAEQRHDFMIKYLKQFRDEVDLIS